MPEKKKPAAKKPAAEKAPKVEPESESVGTEAEVETVEVELSVIEGLQAQQTEMQQLLEEANRQREEVARTLQEAQQRMPAPMFKAGTDGERIDDREWGPFADYQYQTTDYGEYAIPLGKVLYFVGVQQLNRDTMRMEVLPLPAYRDATEEERKEANVPTMAPLAASRIKPPKK